MRKARLQWIILLAVFVAVLALPLHAQERETVTPEEALKYHGQSRTICGKIASTRYAAKSKDQPTFLHLGKPYPEHAFTIVIWGRDRGKFEKPPEELYWNMEVCVSGLIVEHNGKPQIVVKNPSQISIKDLSVNRSSFSPSDDGAR
jgi:hypothetical protein